MENGKDNLIGGFGGEEESTNTQQQTERTTFRGNASGESQNTRSRFDEPAYEENNSLADMFKRRSDTFNSGLGSDSVLQDAKTALTDLLGVAKNELDFEGKDYAIIPIDKKAAGVHYSSVVLAARLPARKAIAYVVLMLSGTGRKELTVNGILKSIPTAQEARMSKKTVEDIEREIVLPVDTYDEDIYRPYVEEQIGIKFQQKENENIYFINAFVANSDVTFVRNGEQGSKIPTEESIEFFEAMFNSLSYISKTKNDRDFSFIPIIEAKRQGALLTGSFSLTSDIKKPIRADVNISLNIKFGNANRTKSVNAQAGEQEIIQTSAYVAPILGRRTIKDPSTGRDVLVNKASPVVIISDIRGIENTLKYTLAGIVSALPMINNDMYPYAVMNSKSNWGSLLAYEFGDVADENAIVDLKSHEYTQDSVVATIDSICGDLMGDMTAGLAIEIPMSTLSHGLGILRAAADDDRETSEVAGAKIIKALSEMTGGKFPSDFDPLAIFTNWTILPEGYYVNAKTDDKSPLQNVDLAKLIELGVSPTTLMTANTAQASNAKLDSYLATMDALSEVSLGSAIVTGKTIRAFFSKEFISTLINVLNQSGLTIYTDPLITRSALGKFEELHMGYGRSSIGFTSTNTGFSAGPSRIPNTFKGARRNMY